MLFLSEAMKKEAEKILQAKTEGDGILDILAKIYADRLPDKTLAQGKIMGNAILQEIQSFDADYKTAQTDQDKFINDSLAKMNSGKMCSERCTFWLRVSEVVSCVASVNEDSDKDKIFRELQKLSVTEEEASPEREQELMNKAAQAIKNSPIMLNAFIKHAKELETLQNLDETTKLFISIGSDEVEHRAIVSMLVYTACKNGEVDDVPPDLTAQQVTAAICAEFEQIKIAESVQNGNLAVDVAATLLFVLGTVVLVHFFAIAGALALAVIVNSFGLLLAVPALLMASFGLWRLWSVAIDAWSEDSRTIVKGVAVGIRFIISGLKSLGEFIFGKFLPKLQTTKVENIEPIRNVSFA